MKLFAEPQHLTKDKPEDENAALTEIDYEEQTAGYQAAYSRLAASETIPVDPVAYVRDPREFLGQELSRVMDEVPDVVVTFHQRSTMSHWAAKHAHGTLGQHLQDGFPHLATFPKRLRFTWNIKVWEWEDGPSRMHNEALIQEWQI